MDRTTSRRDALRAGASLLGAGVAGCLGARLDAPLLAESFEDGMDRWETAAAIGPEVPISAFEWHVDRSRAWAADGSWSLEVFTEGDYDDGTAWATTTLSPPADASAFEVSLRAWSESESFNTLRHLVAHLGPEPPAEEADFPDPGTNTTGVADAPAGGLREPLHLAAGWREYAFGWRPPTVPATLHLAVGVSVVWESDATHYLDAVEVRTA